MNRFRRHSRCTNPLCAHAQNGRFRVMLKQCIEKFTQFLQFTLLYAFIIHEHSAYSDLSIFSDQVDQVLLCWYHKQTDIYYSTWSFENVAKNCQFQFLDPPKILLPVSELPVSVFIDPPPDIVASFRIVSFSF